MEEPVTVKETSAEPMDVEKPVERQLLKCPK